MNTFYTLLNKLFPSDTSRCMHKTFPFHIFKVSTGKEINFDKNVMRFFFAGSFDRVHFSYNINVDAKKKNEVHCIGTNGVAARSSGPTAFSAQIFIVVVFLFGIHLSAFLCSILHFSYMVSAMYEAAKNIVLDSNL